MITVVTPFSRKQNMNLMEDMLKGKCNWIVLIDDEFTFPDWVMVKKYTKPPNEMGLCKSNWLFNKFIEEGLDDEIQYMILCDDDAVEDGFFDKIPNDDTVIVSMKRTEDEANTLIASPDNIAIGKVGGEQLILKGKILKNYRYGLSNIGDGEMIMQVARNHPITYVPKAYVIFNFFEDGRYGYTFHRKKEDRVKPVVMFVGDYFCAGNPSMGLSEWEGNIWSSLESTGLVDVCRFHFDKYYYITGNRGDAALLDRIKSIQPDYIVLIIYKFPGQDQAVMTIETLSKIKKTNIPIITIWGDLEAEQQRDIAYIVKPFVSKIIGTANKSIVEELGYQYMHVPKDPRIFYNPNIERDIDVVFSGSYGLGRSERQEVLQYLLDNGVKLVVGGSEGRDHFSTEEYAMRYKRAKIAISFSRAHGINVVNARTFEALSCGAMLIEQDSPELCKLFEENKEFVMWKTKIDLLEKIRYYLQHHEERYSIARSGQEKCQEQYSAKKFWEEAIKNI
jgi:hypothetical protein